MSGSMSDLEKDIEASRARLDETIDRIQDRLTAGSLVDEMLGSARRTPLNGVYDSALEAVRRNPLPVLLIAAGVGMLLSRMNAGGRAAADPGRTRLARDGAAAFRTGADREDQTARSSDGPARERDDPLPT